MAKIIEIGSAKGGVAKTTTTYNLAYVLKEMGYKVLAVDLDPQANLSTCFGIEDTSVVQITIGHLLMSVIDDEDMLDAEEFILRRNGVDYIPASMMLSAVEAKLRMEMGSEKMLSYVLEPLRERYDFILIDTSPSLGALTINAIAAADEVIVTVNPQLLAMMGLQDYLKTITKIRNRINPKVSVAGILLTMCEPRTNLCKTVIEQVQDTFSGQIRVFDAKIPATVKVGESIYYSEPLLEYAPGCNATVAYTEFGRELIADEG